MSLTAHFALGAIQLIASLGAIFAIVWAVGTHRLLSPRAEASLHGLKLYRVVMLAVLACAQGSIVLVFLRQHEPWGQAFMLEVTLLTAIVAWAVRVATMPAHAGFM